MDVVKLVVRRKASELDEATTKVSLILLLRYPYTCIFFGTGSLCYLFDNIHLNNMHSSRLVLCLSLESDD